MSIKRRARVPAPVTAISKPISVLSGAAQVIRQSDGKSDIVQLDMSNRDALAPFGGSESPSFNATMLRQVLACLWVPDSKTDSQATARALQTVGAALRAFKPTDEIEGMIAAQAVAAHLAAMECLRRANIAEQPFEIASRLRKDAANMMRTMTEMLEALDRKRGKGPQVVRVERVVVHEGGQAIVGNVAPRGEG